MDILVIVLIMVVHGHKVYQIVLNNYQMMELVLGMETHVIVISLI